MAPKKADQKGDIAKQVEDDLLEKTRPVVTGELKKKWLKIGAALAVYGEPPMTLPADANDKNIDKDIDRYSKEFIEQRKANVTLADGSTKTIALTDIDAAITRYNTDNPDKAQPLISNEIPSIGTLRKTAEATERGAESQSGWGSKIMNFLAGLMQWIMSLFSGEPKSLWDCVADAAAPKVGNAITKELNQAAANDPNVAKFLRHQVDGATVADTIVSQAMDTTREIATGKKNPPKEVKPSVALDRIIMESPDLPTSNEDIKKRVSATIIDEGNVYAIAYDELKKMRDKQVAETKGFEGWFARNTGYGVPKDEDIEATARKASRLIADTVAETVADPNVKTAGGVKLSSLSREDFAKEMANRIITKAEKEQKTLGIDAKMFEKKPGTDKSPIDELSPHLENALVQEYHKLQPAMKVAAMNEDRRIAAVRTQATALDKDNSKVLSETELKVLDKDKDNKLTAADGIDKDLFKLLLEKAPAQARAVPSEIELGKLIPQSTGVGSAEEKGIKI